MWAHREWIGRHLPVDTPTGGELGAYATWCTAVEGNTTFYATPSEDTVERWRADAPPGFEFCFKLPREVTHDRRLRNAEAATEAFLDRMAPLAAALGPIQIQLPPSFSGEDAAALGDFLRWVTDLDPTLPWAVELRHPDYFVGGRHERAVDDLLGSHGVSRVILDSRALFDLPPETPEEIDAWEKKPRLPVRPVATADRPIVRLIGSRDLEASVERWQQWIPALVRWLAEGRSPIVFTHTPDNVDAPPLARRFHEQLRSAAAVDGIHVDPLPTPRTAGEQLDLWDDGPMAADRPGSG